MPILVPGSLMQSVSKGQNFAYRRLLIVAPQTFVVDKGP